MAASPYLSFTRGAHKYTIAEVGRGSDRVYHGFVDGAHQATGKRREDVARDLIGLGRMQTPQLAAE